MLLLRLYFRLKYPNRKIFRCFLLSLFFLHVSAEARPKILESFLFELPLSMGFVFSLTLRVFLEFMRSMNENFHSSCSHQFSLFCLCMLLVLFLSEHSPYHHRHYRYHPSVHPLTHSQVTRAQIALRKWTSTRVSLKQKASRERLLSALIQKQWCAVTKRHFQFSLLHTLQITFQGLICFTFRRPYGWLI